MHRFGDDQYELERFVLAQEGSSGFELARKELAEGRKNGHWIWYIFPQIAGLGYSVTSQKYSIASLDEARAYLSHPILGPRLREITALIISCKYPSIKEVVGQGDAKKVKSSMTLFSKADPEEENFIRVIQMYFEDELDENTLRLLE